MNNDSRDWGKEGRRGAGRDGGRDGRGGLWVKRGGGLGREGKGSVRDERTAWMKAQSEEVRQGERKGRRQGGKE